MGQGMGQSPEASEGGSSSGGSGGASVGGSSPNNPPPGNRGIETPGNVASGNSVTGDGAEDSTANLKRRDLKGEPWFAKLPPALRKAIQAKSRGKIPRGYEERLRRYFENVD